MQMVTAEVLSLIRNDATISLRRNYWRKIMWIRMRETAQNDRIVKPMLFGGVLQA